MSTTLRNLSRLGAWCWVLAGPVLLVANLVVPLGWTGPGYDWTWHNISDLGNVHCGTWDTSRPRQVCSPWHPVMNAAFVLTGLLLLGGIVTAGRPRPWSRRRAVALVLLGLGSSGYLLAGLRPADVDENLHVLAAFLLFVVANAGLLVSDRLGAALGALAVVAVVLFLAQRGPLIGIGGMERLAVSPLLLWAFLEGLSRLRVPPLLR